MKRWMKLVIFLLVLAGCAVGGMKAWDILTDQSTVGETFYQVQSSKLVSDVRVVFLSDLHLATFGEDNCDLVDRIEKLKPNLILIGGDMNVCDVDDYSVVLSLCRQLTQIADVYYALGNHELTRIVTVGRQIYDDIEATGVTMLNDVYKKVRVGDNTLYIGGLSESGKGIEAYSNDIIGRLAENDGFKLLLSHYPSNFDVIKHEAIDLVLSGHLHGGQIHLPYFDGLYSEDSGLLPPYTEGEFFYGDAEMIVSRGLGSHSIIPRVNNPPELVIVDLCGSANTYSLLRLMKQFDALTQAQQEDAEETVAEDAQESGGLLINLMDQKKQVREELADALLKDEDENETPVHDSTPEPSTEPSTEPSATVAASSVPCFVPDTLYLPAGEPCALSLDNILASNFPDQFSMRGADAGEVVRGIDIPEESGALRFSIVREGQGAQSYETYVRRAAAGASARANVLFMGDSFVDGDVLPCETARWIHTEYGMPDVSFIGGRVSEYADISCRNEGRGGYGACDFLKTDAAYRADFPNPYLASDGVVSLKSYLDANGQPAPDVLVTYMGVNDLSELGLTSDGSAEETALRMAAWLDLVHAEYPDCRALVCGIVYVSDANGAVPATDVNRQIMRLNRAYQALCGQDAYKTWCVYADTATVFPRADGYRTEQRVNDAGETVTVQTDWVHPSETGYRMLAKSVAAALACLLQDGAVAQ